MAETFDFDKIARAFVERVGVDLDPAQDHSPFIVREVVDELRAAWNARGAADIATVRTVLTTVMDVTGATLVGPYVKILDRELRKLDR